MAINYRIYSNGGTGGALDLTTPIATVSASPYVTDVLTAPGDYTFLVRAFDTVTGWEDLNTESRRLVLDSGGDDVTNRPLPPGELSATPIAAGGIRVEWSYLPPPGSAQSPTGFKVWVSNGAINYALTPNAAVAYTPRILTYEVELPGFTNGVTYTIGVRATNASGDETNTITTTCVADSVGPLPVTNLTGVPSY